MNSSDTLVFGPSYVDVVIYTDERILAHDITLDQSLPTIKALDTKTPNEIAVTCENSSTLTIDLPTSLAHFSTNLLCHDIENIGVFTREITPKNIILRLGGMGAGFAKALSAQLIYPGADDELGSTVKNFLQEHGINAFQLDSAFKTDSSIVILNDFGEKLAFGTREQIGNMRENEEIVKLLGQSKKAVFCSSNNDFTLNLLSKAAQNSLPKVILAPSKRNLLEGNHTPFGKLAPYTHYLALNRDEWSMLSPAHKSDFTANCKLITITDGKNEIELIYEGNSVNIAPSKVKKVIDVARAGETFASVIVKYLEELESIEDACFYAKMASEKAAEQLMITDFGFPKI